MTQWWLSSLVASLVAIVSFSSRFAQAATGVERATYEVFHVAFDHPGDGVLKQSVAVFRVHFDAQLSLERQLNGSLEDAAFFPEASESQYGLTQLRCGDVLVRSHPTELPPDTIDYVPDFLVPSVHAGEFSVSEVALLLSATNRVRDRTKSFYEAIMFLGDRSRGFGSGVSVEAVSSCVMDFLPVANQTWLPGGAYMDGDGQAVLPAGIQFAPLELQVWPFRNGAPIDTAATERVGQLAGQILRHVFFNGTNATDVAETTLHKKRMDDCVPLPHGIEQGDPISLLQVTSLTDTVGGLFKSALGSVLSPVMSSMASVISSLLTPLMGEGLKQATDKGFDSEITSLLSHMLADKLATEIVGPLSAAIPPSVAESTAETVSALVSTQLTDRLSGPVAEQVTKALDAAVPLMVAGTENSPTVPDSRPDSGDSAFIEMESPDPPPEVSALSAPTVPQDIAASTTKTLLHTLTRSLTHTVVPALLHTLTHNPLEDYYCYYCFHKKVYCQYCHYSPQQLYYSLYYAGFYSTYYADYFGDYFTQGLSILPSHPKIQEFASSATRLTAGESS
mmetsp:Transcript_4318/g.13990  ORF Transcript_4318/g.13990 Transcript_4318/m.13990 type:complete len:563 (-) Transcript_4318:24-1712(-)